MEARVYRAPEDRIGWFRSMEIRGRTVVVSMVVGTLVTVAAAIVPARRAARPNVLEAIASE